MSRCNRCGRLGLGGVTHICPPPMQPFDSSQCTCYSDGLSRVSCDYCMDEGPVFFLGGRDPADRRQRMSGVLMRSALAGGLATSPLVMGVCGFAAHWNAYTNLFLVLSAGVFWLVLWLECRAVLRPPTPEGGAGG